MKTRIKTKKHSKNVLTKKKRRFLVLSSFLAVSLLTLVSILAMNQESYLSTFIGGLGGRAVIVNRPIASSPAENRAAVNPLLSAGNFQQNKKIAPIAKNETGRIPNRATNLKSANNLPDLADVKSKTQVEEGDGVAAKVGETQSYVVSTEDSTDPNSFYQQWWDVGINADQVEHDAPDIKKLESLGYDVYYEEATVDYNIDSRGPSEAQYTVIKYYAIDRETGEKWIMDYGGASTPGGDGYYIYQLDEEGNKTFISLDEEGKAMVSTVSDADFYAAQESGGEPTSDAPVLRLMDLNSNSSDSSADSSTGENYANTIEESNSNISASAVDISDSVSSVSDTVSSEKDYYTFIKKIYPQFSISDISNAEKAYLGKNSGLGKDVNGDGVFNYADVISLIQCWNNDACRGEN